MYVYAPDMPIDIFGIMRQVETFFWELRDREMTCEYLEYPMSSETLREFVENCFWCVAKCENYWEGDVRSKEIYIGSMPDVDSVSLFFYLAFKQDNNGSSFIVSEFEIPYLKQYLCSAPRKSSYVKDWQPLITGLCSKLFPYNKPTPQLPLDPNEPEVF